MQTHLKAIDVLDFLKIDFTTSHSRRTDPETSRLAAESMENVSTTQCAIILNILEQHGNLSKSGIAQFCDLSDVQVARRLADLKKRNLARPIDVTITSEHGRQERAWTIV